MESFISSNMLFRFGTALYAVAFVDPSQIINVYSKTALCTFHNAYCTMHVVLYTLHYAHYFMHIALWTLHYVYCTRLPYAHYNKKNCTVYVSSMHIALLTLY